MRARQLSSIILELAGLATIVVGVNLLAGLAWALIVGGVLAVVLAQAIST